MKITKRSGRIVVYDDEKLVKSIMKANEETGEKLTVKEAEYLTDVVIGRLAKVYSIITTQMIKEGIYDALMEKDLWLTAKQYKEFKKEEK